MAPTYPRANFRNTVKAHSGRSMTKNTDMLVCDRLTADALRSMARVARALRPRHDLLGADEWAHASLAHTPDS
jgi:hypothetical protein